MNFPLRGVLFDFDDTLFSTRHLIEFRKAQDWAAVHAQIGTIQPFPGVINCLQRLRAKGYRIAIVTNSPSDIPRAVLQHHGITMDAIVGYHDTTRHKPHPAPLLEGARQLQLRPATCAAVGDRCHDIIAARDAHMTAIGAEWGAEVPKDVLTAFSEYLCSTPNDLADILEELFDRVDGPVATAAKANTTQRINTGFWSTEPNPGLRRQHLDNNDTYVFGRWRYRGNFSVSYANSVVSNFKMKPVHRTNHFRWRHKEQAVTQYTGESTYFLPQNSTVLFLPSSKLPGHPEYDPRLEMLAAQFAANRPDIRIVNPISPRTSTAAVHENEDTTDRDPYVIGANLIWNGGLPEDINHIYIMDDVITSGGHFKAYKNLLRAHAPNVQVTGLFWSAER